MPLSEQASSPMLAMTLARASRSAGIAAASALQHRQGAQLGEHLPHLRRIGRENSQAGIAQQFNPDAAESDGEHWPEARIRCHTGQDFGA